MKEYCQDLAKKQKQKRPWWLQRFWHWKLVPVPETDNVMCQQAQPGAHTLAIYPEFSPQFSKTLLFLLGWTTFWSQRAMLMGLWCNWDIVQKKKKDTEYTTQEILEDTYFQIEELSSSCVPIEMQHFRREFEDPAANGQSLSHRRS